MPSLDRCWREFTTHTFNSNGTLKCINKTKSTLIAIWMPSNGEPVPAHQNVIERSGEKIAHNAQLMLLNHLIHRFDFNWKFLWLFYSLSRWGAYELTTIPDGTRICFSARRLDLYLSRSTSAGWSKRLRVAGCAQLSATHSGSWRNEMEFSSCLSLEFLVPQLAFMTREIHG